MSRRRGVKTYHPHNVATIIYGLLALAMVAVFALPFIQPLFNFAKEGEEAIVFTGLDFVKVGLSKFLSSLKGEKQEAFLYYLTVAVPDNDLLKMIIKFHWIVELAIVGFLALAALFAFIEFFVGAFWLVIGKSDKAKTAKTLAWLIFWLYAFAFGLLFMYFFFYQQIVAFAEITIKITFTLYSYVFLGAMFVIAFIMMIINRAYFKDRVAIDRKEDEKVYTISDTTESTQTVSQDDRSVRIQTKTPGANPNGIITVGENAYAKNPEIASATIPEGIISLGSSAFANCVNMVAVELPSTIKEIGFNCFFNTPKLTSITFNGPIEKWKNIKRGSNWLMKSGTRTVQCTDGKINVNPRH